MGGFDLSSTLWMLFSASLLECSHVSPLSMGLGGCERGSSLTSSRIIKQRIWRE